jgi:aminoglycoside phosphotransferase (APT) family kinase protein
VTPDRALAQLGEIVRRSPFAYASSWPLEEVELVREDGTELRLVVKHLGRVHAGKPAFVCDPAREIEVYRLLAGEHLGTPRCYASGRWWLALEKVEARPLWQSAEVASWAASARWAAELHEHFRSRPLAVPPLMQHGRSLYRRWFDRASAMRGDVAALEPALENAIGRLAALPPTLVHGELYPANLLVAERRVAAVDWEMAAAGPGVIDLAALVTGWEGGARSAIVAAYGGTDDLDLVAAELVLAIQWLGWSEAWEAPPSQRRDWLAEARAAARALG